MRVIYILLQKGNMRLMKDNARLYRMIRLSKLQKENPNPNPKTHFALETLAEAAISLQDPEAAHDAVDIPNLMQVEEIPEGQK